MSLGGQVFAQLESIENPSVTIAITNMVSPTTCGANDGSITVSGGNQYVWSNGQNTATASNLEANDYTVTVTNSYGCSADSNITLIGPAFPVIVSQPTSSSHCEGDLASVTVTATGSSLTYQWWWNTYIITGATSNTYTIPSITTAEAGNYYCVITSGSCSTTSNTALIMVTTSPTADAGADQVINYLSSVAIGSGSVAGYTYAWSPSTGLSSANVSNPMATPLSTTTYVVTVTNTSGCTATDAVNVTVVGTPLQASVTALPSTICLGSSSILNTIVVGGSGSYNYIWSTGAITSAITVTPTTTTSYSVTVTDGSQSTIASTIVTVATSPIASAGTDQTIALGNSASIGTAALPGYTYSWSSNPSGFSSTLAQPNVIPTISTIYTVIATNSSGCTATDDVVIWVTGGTFAFVNPSVPITSSLGTTIYQGDASQLATMVTGGTPPYTYIWSPATGLSSTTVYNPVATPPATTTYSVLVQDGGGQTLNASLLITVLANNPPTASIGNGTQNQDVCLGEDATINVTLTGEAPWTITYSDGSSTMYATTSDSLYPLVITPSAVGSFVYSISNVADNNYATGMGTGYALVNVMASPIVDLGVDQDLCNGNSLALSDQSGGSYSYYLWSTGATTPGINITPTTTTTYWLEAINSSGCTATDTMVVTVNSIPTINAGLDVQICEGDSVTLTATGGTSYFWSTGATTNPITISPTTTTQYTVTGWNGNGCQSSDQVLVIVNPMPIAGAGVSQTICEGASATLTATGGTSYLWSTGATTASVSVSPTSTTVYTVTVTGGGGCTATAQTSVVVVANPTVDAGMDVDICEGSNTTFNIVTTNATTYSWTPTTGLSNPNIANPTATPATSTTYTVVASNATGCMANDQITVTVNPVPVVTANDVYTCVNDPIQLNASSSVIGCTYNWTPATGLNNANIANPTATLTGTTTYTVLATSPDGCVGVDMITVTVNPLPIAEFTANVLIDSSGTVDFTNWSTNATSYLWDFGNGDTSTDVNPSYTYAANGSYNVWLTATNACGDDVITHIISGIFIGIEEIPLEAENISMFPNPTRDILNIANTENIESVQLYDLVGNSLRTIQIYGESQIQFNISELPSGIYNVVFTTTKGNPFVKRIVKQ